MTTEDRISEVIKDVKIRARPGMIFDALKNLVFFNEN